jgi:hypothetical protein
MLTDGSRLERIARILVTGATAVLVATLAPSIAEGQTAYGQFCKKIEPKSDYRLAMYDCGNKFTTADRYVGIIVRLGQFDEDLDLAVELLDPDQTSVWTYARTFQVPPGRYYPDFWMYRVLPVTADESALASENLNFPSAMIRVDGKPVKERIGDWTLRIRVRRNPPVAFKFTLQAAP